jgi:hypothetical protein
MTQQERCESVSGYLYGEVCLDRLEKAGLMDLFLTMSANGSNSVVMASNGPQLQLWFIR